MTKPHHLYRAALCFFDSCRTCDSVGTCDLTRLHERTATRTEMHIFIATDPKEEKTPEEKSFRTKFL